MKKKFIRLACGLDISKKSFHACFGGQNEQGDFIIQGQRKFSNTFKGIEAFLLWLEKYCLKFNKDKEIPFQLLMETTGVYHEGILFATHEAGIKVCLELAKRVKLYLRSIGQESKTDKLDARGICRMACERKFRLWQPASKNIYRLRTALRQRKSLIKSRVRFSNQLHAQNYSQSSSKEVKASIERMIKQLKREIAKLEKHIVELYERDKRLHSRLNPIIESVLGLGLFTALTIVAETNAFSLVTSRKQLASYAGYDIIENSSGAVHRKTKISKQGNARIRSELYMAAAALIRSKKGPIYELYLRIRKRNPKIYKIANVAVQRKLLLLVYTLFKKQERFDLQKYHLTKPIEVKQVAPSLAQSYTR